MKYTCPQFKENLYGDHRIERLFDSIMRNYPIGTFLFWLLREENVNKYTFYRFIKDYHERDSKNELAPKPELKKNIIGVLDGQQRLSSMYIALQGTYAYKKPYCQWNNDEAFPKRELYLNLLFDKKSTDDYEYEFSFLPLNEPLKLDKNNLWFHVRDVLEWDNIAKATTYFMKTLTDPNIDQEVKNEISNRVEYVQGTLAILYQKLVTEPLINYFEVNEQELDNILDIFIRVNSAGTVLSKSDLLFSTIVAHWEKGREEIDNLVSDLNKIGETFKFNSDFIMRSCLFLIDAPVLFKVASFDKSNIQKIVQSWDNIKSALTRSVKLISEFGFNYENLTSSNAVIPIAYYLYKGGQLQSNDKMDLQKYMICALTKQIFGSQGDQVLTHIRESLYNSGIISNKNFFLDSLANDFGQRNKNKSLNITQEDIEEMLEYKKGAYSFMVLSLLYPNLKYGQVKFHQDHIHPYASFRETQFKALGLNENEKLEWLEMRDKLPNLQLLEGTENIIKNGTSFKDWLSSDQNPNRNNVAKYKLDNYIDVNENEEFSNFKNFYEERRGILKSAISSKLGV